MIGAREVMRPLLAFLLAFAAPAGAAAETASPSETFAAATIGLWQTLPGGLDVTPTADAIADALVQCGKPEAVGRVLADSAKLRPRDLLEVPGALAFLRRDERLYRVDLLRMNVVGIGEAEPPDARGKGHVWTVRAGQGRMRLFLQERAVAGRSSMLLADATGLYLKCPSVAPKAPAEPTG